MKGPTGSFVAVSNNLLNAVILGAVIYLLCTIPLASSQSASLSYVIEPFDEIRAEWAFDIHRDQGSLNVTMVDDDDVHDHDDLLVEKHKVMRVDYNIVQTENWGGYATVKSELQEGPISCIGADYLSLLVKILQPQEPSSHVHLRLNLLDDSDSPHRLQPDDLTQVIEERVNFNFLENYYSFHYIMDGDGVNDWMELKVPLVGSDQDDAPFYLPGWSGILGNKRLDLDHIRAWHLEWSIDTEVGMGNFAHGSILLDQLACVGGEQMIGGPLHIQNYTMEVAQQEGLWSSTTTIGSNSPNNHTSAIGLVNTSFPGDGLHAEYHHIVHGENEETSFQVSYQHVIPLHMYYDLGHDATGVVLDIEWFPESPNHEETVVEFSFLGFSEANAESSSCHDNPCEKDMQYAYSSSHKHKLEPTAGLNATAQHIAIDGLFDWVDDRLNNESLVSPQHIKGFRITITISSSQIESNQSVPLPPLSGFFKVTNLRSTHNGDNGANGNNATNDTDPQPNDAQCVLQPGVTSDLFSSLWTRYGFLGDKCCDACMQAGEDCMYFAVFDRICFIASHLDFIGDGSPIRLANNDLNDNEVSMYWKDDTHIRGDFCSQCVCDAHQRFIDCRGQDLVQIPKTFSANSWTPIVLDLRDNPRIFFLGAGVLDAIAADLQEIKLPKTMEHISIEGLRGMPKLSEVHMETDQASHLEAGSIHTNNMISEPDGIFSDICCSQGDQIDLSSSSNGLVFCDMRYFAPGIDSEFADFQQYFDATSVATLTQSSPFMAEAAESAENCAEYCSISGECNFFTYDARIREAEHTCYLFRNNGTTVDTVCCHPNDYKDEEQTQPGFVSGYPPRTRHDFYNAKVLFSDANLKVDDSNMFTAQYEISLGAPPRRGAVWIDIDTSSPSSDHFSVSIEPRRVALYDDQTAVKVTIQVTDLGERANGQTIILLNSIRSCDTAFTSSETLSSDGIVYVEIERAIIDDDGDDDDDDRNDSEETAVTTTTIMFSVLLSAAVMLAAVVAYLYVEHTKQRANSMWQIKSSELTFKDPPEIIGQGTFGLVLLAEYRGTQVAVKRIAPPRKSKPKTDSQLRKTDSIKSGEHNTEDSIPSFAHVQESESRTTDDTCAKIEPASLRTGAGGDASPVHIPETKGSSYLRLSSGTAKVKADFVAEIKQLSTLRHPNVTTVMGAVLDKNHSLLVMEYMDHGSLRDVMQNDTIILEGEQILPILRDITLGLRFLHAAEPQVIHGDIKAANILIDNRFRAKVADFGLSQRSKLGARGTPYWMAPELLRQEQFNSAPTDVYSFGIVLYEMYARADPYDGESFGSVLQQIIDPSVCRRPLKPRECPKFIARIMKDCLMEESSERPSFEKLQQIFKDCHTSDVDPINRRRSQTHRSLVDGSKSDQLLYGVFPRHIAEALREGKEIQPETHDLVTIFFSDIVGFTQLASTMTPLQISDLLDRLYSAFDDLSLKHDVFKVETIGDAYMACSNLVTDQSDDHAKRIAHFAIDAINVANETRVDMEDPSRGFISIRVGFHSGPVVANVVGSRNPRYCLFGDTVNTSNRMESHSTKDRIHCSDRAAKLLCVQDPNIGLTPRGLVEIKSKGKMRTYWVNEGSRIDDITAPLHQHGGSVLQVTP